MSQPSKTSPFVFGKGSANKLNLPSSMLSKKIKITKITKKIKITKTNFNNLS